MQRKLAKKDKIKLLVWANNKKNFIFLEGKIEIPSELKNHNNDIKNSRNGWFILRMETFPSYAAFTGQWHGFDQTLDIFPIIREDASSNIFSSKWDIRESYRRHNILINIVVRGL